MADRPSYAVPSVDTRDSPDVQTVAGNVVVTGDVTTDVTFPDVQTINGTVVVDNLDDIEFPTSVGIAGPVSVSGSTVSVDNFPSPVDVSALATQTTLAAVLAALGGVLDVTGSAVDVSSSPSDGRYVGGKTAVCATVTASGDTTIYTPAAGNAVRLYWISAINDPDEATTPLVKVLLGATEVYRAYAVAHWEIFEGAADDPLTINLSSAASIAVTAHIEEITP